MDLLAVQGTLNPDPGIEPVSLVSPALASGFFITVPPGKLVHRREAQGEAGHPQRHPDPGAPQDEAGLTRKFETSHVGGVSPFVGGGV